MQPSAPLPISDDILERARRVRFLCCDVDGVLTDGKIYVDDHGHETKAFSALDGVGLNLLSRAGIVVAWITGSAAPAVTHRARRLNVRYVMQDVSDKLAVWEELRAQLGIDPADCAHIGDDLPDVPVFHACGFAVSVPHAPDSVRAQAHYITTREAGNGAVRELAELILDAQRRLLAGAPPRSA